MSADAQAALGNAALVRRARQARASGPPGGPEGAAPAAAESGTPRALAGFAEAPPSRKALEFATLGTALSGELQAESSSFDQSLPAVSAELSGEQSATPARSGGLRAPTGEAGRPVAGEGPRPPSPDLEATAQHAQAPAPVSERETRERLTVSATPAQRERTVEAMLDAAQSQGQDVPVSPGPAPAVPLEGSADPARADDQAEHMLDEAGAATREARRAVVEGPGPEQVQPLTLHESFSLAGEPPAPASAETAPVEGMTVFVEQGLPPEVQAAFDEDQHGAMAASAARAQAELEAATAERDAARADELARADAESRRLSGEAQSEQEAHVAEQRERIDQERRNTVEAQQEALAGVETEVETQRAEQRQRIDTRVSEDEGRIDARYAETGRQARDEVARGEGEAERLRTEAEREAEDRSWWEEAVDVLADLVEALTDAITAVFDAVRQAVNVLLDAARAFATAIIDAAVAFISEAIAAFGAFLQRAVRDLLGSVFPELAARLSAFIDEAVTFAREKVRQLGERLKAGVAALCDAVRRGLESIQAAFQAAARFALTVVQAALTGDWSEVLRMMLDAALKVAGISPEEFNAFIGSAMETLSLILDAPGDFLSNLIDAVVGGVRQFSRNFLTHLQRGFVQWLTGALRGITLPETLDLAGVFSLVLQVLGLDRQGIRALAARVIGEENVERLEAAWSYLETLLEGGFSALWERIQESLGDLWDTVVGGLQQWLMTEVVEAAVMRLATLFTPVGALVQALLTAWNVYTFVRDQLERIAGVARAVVGSISQIARRSLGPAMDSVETVLAGLVPLAIDLLAKLLGLSNVGDRVQEIITSVRQRIEAALRGLIERVRGMFRRERGAAPPGERAAGDGEIGETLQFSAGGERHRLWINVQGRTANVMVASSAGPVTDKLRDWRRALQQSPSLLVTSVEGREDRTNRTRAEQLLGQAETKLGITQQEANEAVQETQEALQRPAPEEARQAAESDAQTERAEVDLQAVLRELFTLFDEPHQGLGQHGVYGFIGRQVVNPNTRRFLPVISGSGVTGYRWTQLPALPANIERAGGASGQAAPTVHVDAECVLREGPAPSAPLGTSEDFASRFGLVQPSGRGGATTRLSSARRSQRFTPAQVPATDRRPGYAIAVTGVPGAPTAEIARRYATEAWSEPGQHQAGTRMSAVVGINLMESLNRDDVVARVESGVGSVAMPPEMNVDAFGFLWQPRWQMSTRPGQPPSAPVDIHVVRESFARLPEEQKQQVLRTERAFPGSSTRNIPYGLLREEVVTSPEIQQQIRLLARANDPVYIHVTDPDAVGLRVQSGQGVLEKYDELLAALGRHPLLVAGGYNFSGLSHDSPITRELTQFAHYIDQILRRAVAEHLPRMIYPTEPNLLILAQHGEQNLFDRPDLSHPDAQGEQQPLFRTDERGNRVLSSPGALFGIKGAEGSRLRRNLLDTPAGTQLPPEEFSASLPEASIPTAAVERFLVPTPAEITTQSQTYASAYALAFNFAESLPPDQRAALIAASGRQEPHLALMPRFQRVSEAVDVAAGGVLGTGPRGPAAPAAEERRPAEPVALPPALQSQLDTLITALVEAIQRALAEPEVMARWQHLRQLLDDARSRQQ
ncbi:hypothetical protein [Pyxidicoccus xibeiensis]|uniref:hypothetical protein n=1 Tax=Pyxidicoccus xibeiensis TaxID=2906759 RepID=UPI0020A73366|nr:hypothetical protein [Pyxidicoccus xibeiensis]MCP3143381.1 hypothetical protein [Pyxidicoccus xibeiensis]